MGAITVYGILLAKDGKSVYDNRIRLSLKKVFDSRERRQQGNYER